MFPTCRKGIMQASQNIQKSSKTLLTPKRGADYIRLTNDGGDAAGDKEVRFWVQPKVGRNQESRVSDTQPGPKPKSEAAHDSVSTLSDL